ncbi:hypothetical protein GIW70_17775 [Pseudomonas syringae]|nr:hypothetical protein [Pseudomonas syringae]MCF5070039.1 hypothetical protein [Pseudomonas syringae]
MAVDQLRWFRLHGIDRNGDEYVVPIAQGAPVTKPEVGSGLDNTVPRELLLKFQPGSTLRIELKVAFDGHDDESAAVCFTPRILQLLDSPPVLLQDFTEVPSQTVRAGEVIEVPGMLITFKSGEGECAITERTEIGESFTGRIEGQVLSVGREANGVDPVNVELALSQGCSRISFWHVSSNYDDSTVSYYNDDGALLGVQRIGASYGTPVNVEFAATGIVRLDFHCPTPDWFSMDNFRVQYF